MIKTSHLTKRFDGITALDHVDAEIREGAVFGLIGTNGAGKSTFLKLLTGILKPDEGEVLIDGTEIFGNPQKKTDFFYISADKMSCRIIPLYICLYYAGNYKHI